MRILILNWRCPTNPRAGGAEQVTFEVARRLVRAGDSVEWFAAGFPGAPQEELVDGVRIVRAGRQWSVHWRAFLRYRKRLADHFDVVVDQINTIPFFTPLWAKVPTVMFIHQLAREVWWYESGFPLNRVGFIAEPWYLRAYRDVPVITVSQSTKMDLEQLGFRGSLTVIPEGLEALSQVVSHRPKEPAFLYAGRMSPSKRVDDVLRAFAQFCNWEPQARLELLGDGPERYVQGLRELAGRLGVDERVRFLGRVSTLEKHRAMANAHMLLLASVREGWGLVVTEANAFGTPAVAYDVAGLRDSIRNGVTGLLVDPMPAAMAAGMIDLWRDQTQYRALSAAAQAWSRGFSFDESADRFGAALSSAAGGQTASSVLGALPSDHAAPT